MPFFSASLRVLLPAGRLSGDGRFPLALDMVDFFFQPESNRSSYHMPDFPLSRALSPEAISPFTLKSIG